MAKAKAKKKVENAVEAAVETNEASLPEQVTFNLGQTVRIHGVLGLFVITFINNEKATVNLVNNNGQMAINDIAVSLLRP